ncbi:MAG: type II secretion system protein [Chthoniobacterales bacterium]
MKFGSKGGYTGVEFTVSIAIVAILAGLALPAISHLFIKASEAQTLKNGQTIALLASYPMEDRKNTADTNIIGWPGTNTSFAIWVRSLTNAQVTPPITRKMIAQLFSAPGVKFQDFPEYVEGKTAFRIYTTSKDSRADTVLLSTYNWNAENSGPLSSKNVPYGDRGFIVVRLGGDAVFYSAKQATNASSFFGTVTKNVRP